MNNLLAGLRGRRLPTFVLVSSAIFSGSLLAGYSSEPSESGKVLEELTRMLGPLKTLNRLELAALIFFNNSLKALVSMLSGLAFGLGPFLFLMINGSLLGLIARTAATEHGVAVTLLSILPHGILELPAIIVSTALGFRLGIVVFLKILGRGSHVRKEIKLSLVFFAAVILPVLLVAAFVEVFLTGALVGGT